MLLSFPSRDSLRTDCAVESMINQGASYEEIAQALELSINEIRTRANSMGLSYRPWRAGWKPKQTLHLLRAPKP
jgi:hypothetical protein